MSYRKAEVRDLNKHRTQFFTDEMGLTRATEQPTKEDINNNKYYVLKTLGDGVTVNADPSNKGGALRRRSRTRPSSRKSKKSSKRIFRKKSRLTRRR